jgi:hypothetical protein
MLRALGRIAKEVFHEITAPAVFGWDPQKIRVFVIGILEWEHEDIYSPFPKENRRDQKLIEFFKRQQVPAQNIVYLQDQQATTAAIEKHFKQHLSKSQADELLFVYFTGHGSVDDDDETWLASYDADDDENQGWYIGDLPKTINQHFKGSHAVIAIDCCHSGAILDHLPKKPKVNFACLSSSLSTELSTGNWTFTECLLQGFEGRAFVDGNHDNKISLRELHERIAKNMAFAEEQISVFGTAGKFDENIIVSSARPQSHPRIGELVEAYDGDDWYRAEIIDVDGDDVEVHFFGYEDVENCWCSPDEIRHVKWKQFPVGSKVDAKYHGTWYDAVVLEVRGGIHYVRYEIDDSEEWIDSKRIRARKK